VDGRWTAQGTLQVLGGHWRRDPPYASRGSQRRVADAVDRGGADMRAVACVRPMMSSGACGLPRAVWGELVAPRARRGGGPLLRGVARLEHAVNAATLRVRLCVCDQTYTAVACTPVVLVA